MAASVSDLANERLDGLIRAYLGRIGGAAKFGAALGGVNSTRTVEMAPGSPPGAFITGAPWRDLASATSAPLVNAFTAAMHGFAWHIPYSGDPAAGPGVADRAAVAHRVGPDAPAPAVELAMGFFVVGPNVDYFDHQHEPEELYLPIAGRARFWNEAGGWMNAGPDTTMIHPSWQWHAMRTGQEPVLILWMWLGPGGIANRPALRPGLAGVAR